MNEPTAIKYKQKIRRKKFLSNIFFAREYFFPAGCGRCGETLLNPEDAFFGLCGDCRTVLSAILKDKNRCALCGKILVSEHETCLFCRGRGGAGNNGGAEIETYSGALVKIRAFFPYTGSLKTTLGAYKFRRLLGLGNFFAGCLTAALDDFSPAELDGASWVPVPPRPGKIKKKGWDQIRRLAGLLEKSGAQSGQKRLPVCRCLKRLPSRNQKELNREERETNLRGRILCVKKAPGTAFVFDDVITTGATLKACAEALLRGGAKKVFGICLFYD